jgi:uncharacterized protein (DUF433 family)
MAMRMSNAAFGLGAYSPSEAARLTGLPPSQLRRWLFGYSYDHHGAKTVQAPLWRPEYGANQEEPLLGFRDLIEARMVGNLRKLGIGLPTIRICLQTAAAVANDDHPFSSTGFRTDGQRPFLERIGDEGQHDVLDLKTGQHNFAKIVEKSFLDLDFDDEKATRWFLSKKRTIVADPERSFGQPITTDTGVPTRRIAQAVVAEGSAEKVARLFEIAASVVRDAVIFETGLRERMAA